MRSGQGPFHPTHLQSCTDDGRRSYRNVCKMSFISFSLAVIFIIRLFSTSVFRIPEFMHFWIRTRNECPTISDLAIHKLLAFCTTYLSEAIFSKLIIIKSKNRPFLKIVETVLRNCHVSIYEWMICVKIIKCFHAFSCAW